MTLLELKAAFLDRLRENAAPSTVAHAERVLTDVLNVYLGTPLSRAPADDLADAAEAMLDLEARRMYERDPEADAPSPCPCPGCSGLRAALAAYRAERSAATQSRRPDARVFTAHLDRCERCREHPFTLCVVGKAILTGTGLPAAPGKEKP
jgi:hypothetical protein